MIPACRVVNNEIVEKFYSPRGFVEENGIQHAPEKLTLSTDAELAAIGVYPLQIVPDDKYQSNVITTFDGTKGIETYGSYIPLAEAQAIKLAEIRKQAKDIIELKWPPFKQQNADGGRYTAAVKAQMDSDITSILVVSNAAEDEVNLATDTQTVVAVSPVWPTI